MPTYDYKCRGCSNIFEEIVSIDRRDMVLCPRCYYTSERQISKPPVINLSEDGRHGWSNNGYADNTLNNDPEFVERFPNV